MCVCVCVRCVCVISSVAPVELPLHALDRALLAITLARALHDLGEGALALLLVDRVACRGRVCGRV